MNEDKGHKKNTDKKGARLAKNRATRDDTRLLAEIQQLYIEFADSMRYLRHK
ncbi:hypothetical protein [Lacticaseibacillus songhuajiangensis]|uniref:hypothetical protein n=1 Tax=Lacticaseibacillus songhuajiangensis TaxID=1296539 RepID=UPI0013DE3144|nr:hypothetical protein [Lacticaseibacillus songhuajiangensis]